jgi:hypothetical protein
MDRFGTGPVFVLFFTSAMLHHRSDNGLFVGFPVVGELIDSQCCYPMDIEGKRTRWKVMRDGLYVIFLYE